jgi:hypothetical protein
VIAFANTMRIQSMIGNTALILESEMFCQPTLRARWRKDYGYRPEDIRGLAIDDHVTRLRDDLLPLAERFHRMAEAFLWPCVSFALPSGLPPVPATRSDRRTLVHKGFNSTSRAVLILLAR